MVFIMPCNSRSDQSEKLSKPNIENTCDSLGLVSELYIKLNSSTGSDNMIGLTILIRKPITTHYRAMTLWISGFNPSGSGLQLCLLTIVTHDLRIGNSKTICK